jgi:hypothetical protein
VSLAATAAQQSGRAVKVADVAVQET